MLPDLLNKIRYPHDGKRVIFIRQGEFHSGQVFGRHTLTGSTPLPELSPEERQDEVVEAANGLRLPPFVIEERLRSGKKVVFNPRIK